MKNSITLLLVLFSMFTIGRAQEINIHSITSDRQPGGDRGYTLDGLRMANHATPKVINPDHFGDIIYPKYTNLTHGYGASGSLEEIATIENIDLFFFGMFNWLEPTLKPFTVAEIDSLYTWSQKGGKLIIGASAGNLEFEFDPSILNERWGFDIELNWLPAATQLIMPSSEGAGTAIFGGPFGAVPAAKQGGAAQGYFNNIPEDAVVLGVDDAENPNLILDCNTLDLIIADIDAYTDLGGISLGPEIQNDNDIFWLNTIVYMDQLQGPPVIAENGGALSAGSYLSYQWMLDGQPISGATDSTYTATEEGNYSVTVSMSCGCTVTSEERFVTNLTGVEDVFPLGQVHIFPNPVSDQLTIGFNVRESTSLQLNVYNSLGQLVLAASRLLFLPEGHQTIELAVAGLPAGIYEAELAADSGKRAIKFVK